VGFSLGFRRVVIGIADAHRDDGKRFVVCADGKLTALLKLEAVICARRFLESVSLASKLERAED